MADESASASDDDGRRLLAAASFGTSDRRVGRIAAQSDADEARHANLRSVDEVARTSSLLDAATQRYDESVATAAEATRTSALSHAVDTAAAAHRAATDGEVSTSAALARARRLLAVASTDDDSSPIRVDVSAHASVVTFRPHGELDMASSPRLEHVVTDELDRRRARAVVIDLHETTFMDSSALAVLVEVRRVAVERSIDLLLTGVGPRSLRLLERSHLADVFTIM